jgi:competence protein ComEA
MSRNNNKYEKYEAKAENHGALTIVVLIVAAAIIGCFVWQENQIKATDEVLSNVIATESNSQPLLGSGSTDESTDDSAGETENSTQNTDESADANESSPAPSTSSTAVASDESAANTSTDASKTAASATKTATDSSKTETVAATKTGSTAKVSVASTPTIININTASLAELESLDGIGASKAQGIITYRKQNGAFKSTDEIKNVSGIGDSIYSKIKSNIKV